MTLCKLLNNSLDLRQGFPLAVDNFRRTVSKTAVMIDACKPDVFKRQALKNVHRRFRADPAALNFLDQFF